MKLLLCLAMSLGLSAILYFYMKQKISNIEHRLNTLSDVLQTLTNEFCTREVKTISNIPLDNSLLYSIPKINTIDSYDEEAEPPSDTDDSESESDNDSLPELDESESGSDTELGENVSVELEVKLDAQEKKIEFIELNEPEEIIVVHKEKSLEIELTEPSEVPLIKVSDDDVLGTKQVQVSVDYSQLSLKELKQKVNDLGGPPLKTKQALLNFLKNKV